MIPALNKYADGRWEAESKSGLKGGVVRRECFSVNLALPKEAKYRGSWTDQTGTLHWMWFASFRRAAEYVYTQLALNESTAPLSRTKQEGERK